MATPDMNNKPSMQPDMNNPDVIQSDICYPPSAPMQSPPPPLYPTMAPPPYAIPPTAPSSMYPPSYAIPLTAQSLMYPQSPVYITQMQAPYQGIIVANNFMPPQTAHIKDYMIWSIVNVFVGGCLLGMIAILLSVQTKKRKQEGDVAGARSMSNITLTCNILITIIFFALTAFLIIYYVIALSSFSELTR